MTQLSPEENQGGGDSGPGGDSLDSEDELDSTLVQNSASLSLEVDDLSPPLPSSSLPVPSLKPVLDDKILSSVEKGKQSPSRLSLDVECESVTSDYSELGGPLQEIERDLHYIDRDALRTEDALPPIDGGVRNVRSKDLGKGEEETEAEREWRLRKINFLSLAQEFAELKKVDSQACPINFHRNQSAKTFPRTCSPFGSRGHSLERKRNRTHSKSPMRFPEKSASRDYPKNIGNMNDASGGPTVSHPSLPKNIERKLLGKEACVPPAEDLPVNEARRRNSNTDLPANMRTDRCGNSPGVSQKTRTTNPGAQDELGNVVAAEGCGDCEGDFEVYNIETAVMTQMNWHVLEEQLQAVSRLEACRNDREEIRRRLAMSTDEEYVERADSEEQDPDAAFGPRKRLQDRLQAAASGMQICFMNEDDDVDDGVDEENSDGQKDLAAVKGQGAGPNQTEPGVPPPNHPCFPGEIEMFTSKQTKLQSEATLALAQASTMAHMQLEVDKQMRKKSPIADMVGIPTLGSGRRLHLKRTKLQEMNIAQLQVLVNDLHSQIELLNEDLVHLLIERDDLHMEQDSMLVDIEDLTSHCHDPTATNNNKTNINNNRTVSRRDRHT